VLRKDDLRGFGQHGPEPLLAPLFASFHIKLQRAAVVNLGVRLKKPVQFLAEGLPRISQFGNRLFNHPPFKGPRAWRTEPLCRFFAGVLQCPIPLHRKIVLQPEPDRSSGYCLFIARAASSG
jgi:hypothetical protein